MAEYPCHLEPRTMQSALDRSDRDVQRRGRICIVQILQIMEDEDRSVFVADFEQRALNLSRARGARGCIVRRDVVAWALAGFFEWLRGVTFPLAQHVERGVHRNAMDPG